MLGKVSIVTGGSSGIGEAVVNKLSKSGSTVYNLDIQEPKSNALGSWISTDITQKKLVAKAVHHILALHDSIDFFVGAAGVYRTANLVDVTEEDFDAIVNVNMKGMIFVLQSVLPRMREKMSGAIVMIGSDQSFVGKPQSVIYGMTKGAVAQLNKTLAKDNAAFGIRCNLVCPGATDTPLYWNAIERYAERYGHGKSAEDIHASVQSSYILGSRIGTPEEVADAVVFLLSTESRFITGSELRVDGGFVLK